MASVPPLGDRDIPPVPSAPLPFRRAVRLVARHEQNRPAVGIEREQDPDPPTRRRDGTQLLEVVDPRPVDPVHQRPPQRRPLALEAFDCGSDARDGPVILRVKPGNDMIDENSVSHISSNPYRIYSIILYIRYISIGEIILIHPASSEAGASYRHLLLAACRSSRTARGRRAGPSESVLRPPPPRSSTDARHRLETRDRATRLPRATEWPARAPRRPRGSARTATDRPPPRGGAPSPPGRRTRCRGDSA